MFTFLNKKRKEEGITSFMFYFLLFPIFIMVFGYGVDTAMSIYVRNTLQQSLDAATLSAASLTPNPTLGNRNLVLYGGNITERRNTVRDLYDANRSGTISGMLVCPTAVGLGVEAGSTSSNRVFIVNPQRTTINNRPSGVCFQMSDVTVNTQPPPIRTNFSINPNRRARYIEVSVVEYSRNNFIGIFIPQLKYQKYEITSRAVLTRAQD